MEQQFLTIEVQVLPSRAERLRRRRELTALWMALAAASLLVVILLAFLLSSNRSVRGAEQVEEGPAARVQLIEAEKERESRYDALTENERELIARVVYLEARGEPEEGQQAVAEVILNRVAAENFPSSVESVVYQEGQFAAAEDIEKATPGEKQYAAVEAAMYGEPVLPMDVVYFSQKGENENVWGKIGGHVFCYQYVWK